jgi:hypothetical protein
MQKKSERDTTELNKRMAKLAEVRLMVPLAQEEGSGL